MIVTKPEQIKIGQKYKSVILDAMGDGPYVYMGCGWTNPDKKSKYLVIVSSPTPSDIGRMVHFKSNCDPRFWKDGFVEIDED